ncbi:putative ribonuclease H-like domain-containing protein [Tanacetum coccineum]
MDVKVLFSMGRLKKRCMYVNPPGFEDPDFLDRVYKVEKALYGLHQAPRAVIEVQDCNHTRDENSKATAHVKEGIEVNVHMYRSMIGSLMYLTSSRPDIIMKMQESLIVRWKKLFRNGMELI